MNSDLRENFFGTAIRRDGDSITTGNDTPVLEFPRPLTQAEVDRLRAAWREYGYHSTPTLTVSDEGNALTAAFILTVYGAMMLAMGIIIGQVA